MIAGSQGSKLVHFSSPPVPCEPTATGLEVEVGARHLFRQRWVAEAAAFSLERWQANLATEPLAEGSVDLLRATGDYEPFFRLVGKLGSEPVRRWPQLDPAAIWAMTMCNRLRLASMWLDEFEARIPKLHAQDLSFVPICPVHRSVGSILRPRCLAGSARCAG